MSWKVTTQDLNQFADSDSRRAEELAPVLIGKLIKASIDPKQFRFPGGDDIRLPGFDGELKSDRHSLYIPEGTSVWEISKSKDPTVKANLDFRKRQPASDTTYIQVSLRPWPTAPDWRATKADSGWKEVRTIDGVEICTWLEDCPAVHRWLATVVGKRLEGCWDVEEAWEIWQSGTKIKITESLLTYGREEQVLSFQEKLLTERYIQVHGDSTFEAEGFLVCAVKSNDVLSARFLQTDDPSVFFSLASTINHLILLVDQNMPKIGYALDKGHTVIVINHKERHYSGLVFEVPQVTNLDRSKALRELGFQRDVADRIVLQSRNRLDMMRYLPEFEPQESAPLDWSKIDGVQQALKAAFILGHWSWDFKFDCTLFEELTQGNLDQCKNVIQSVVRSEATPLGNDQSSIFLFSRSFLWHSFLRGSIDRVEIIAVVKRVFGLEYDETDARQSYHLKSSVLELLNFFSAQLEVGSDSPIKQHDIDYLIRQILQKESPYELARWLTKMAETAPNVFIKYIKNHTSGGSLPQVFFRERDSDNLYQAMELLAWNRKYLTSAAIILMEMAGSSDGDSGRRAISSLKRIFKVWSPKTAATLQERVQVIEKVLALNEEKGWDLLMELIPHSPRDTTFFTHTPSEKDWHLNRPTISRSDVSQTISSLVDFALPMARSSPQERWPALISRLRYCSASNFDKILTELSTYLEAETEQDIKNDVIINLKEFISFEEASKEGKLSLPENKLAEIRELIDNLSDLSLYDHCKFLFTNHWEIELASSAAERAEKEKEIWRERLRTLRSLADQDPESISRLFKEIYSKAYTQDLVRALKSLESDTLIFDWLFSDSRELVEIAKFTIWQKSCENALWIHRVFIDYSDWTEEQCLIYMDTYVLSEPLLNRLEELSDRSQLHFWTNRYRFVIMNQSLSVLPIIINKLIDVNRISNAVECMANALRLNDKCIELPLVVKTLELFDLNQVNDHQPFRALRETVFLVQWLRDKDLDPDNMINLEWKYLDELHDANIQATTLLERMIKDPSYLVRFYKERMDGKKNIDKIAAKMQIEDRLKIILSSWEDQFAQRIAEGLILVKVIEGLFEEANNKDIHSEISHLVGRCLSKASGTDEATIPSESVCILIENHFNESLRRGYIDGVLNPKPIRIGAYWTNPEDRYLDIIRQYDLAADKFAIKYPNVADIMTALKNEYEYKAEMGW